MSEEIKEPLAIGYNGINEYERDSEVKIEVSFEDGKSYMSDKYYTPPFKLMHPFHVRSKDYLTIILQVCAAGVFAGDVQYMSMRVNDGAKAEMLSQSYEKIFSMEGDGKAYRETKLSVGKNAHLKYTPMPLVPHKQSNFRNDTYIDLDDETSELYFLEVLTGGRILMEREERFMYTKYHAKVLIRQNGKLIYSDNACYEPDKMNMVGVGLYENYTHMANILIMNMNKDIACLDHIRAKIDANEDLEGGASYLECGGICVKIFANSGHAIELFAEDLYKEIVYDKKHLEGPIKTHDFTD